MARLGGRAPRGGRRQKPETLRPIEEKSIKFLAQYDNTRPNQLNMPSLVAGGALRLVGSDRDLVGARATKLKRVSCVLWS
jgi:hypothetical protein